MARFKCRICTLLYAAQFATLAVFAIDWILFDCSFVLPKWNLVARKYAKVPDA